MKNKIIKKFIELVKISSPSGYETLVRNYLIKWLKKNDFSWKIDKIGNLYAKKRNIGKSILFCAHMDTVEPGRNIIPVIKNGSIQSSGNTILGADNKAFISALLIALEKYKGKNMIEIIFSVKEETGGGIEFFPFKWIQSKIGYIFDHAKPIGGIVLRSPFISNFYITIEGKAVHSSVPNKGVNALQIAANILNKIPVGLLDNKLTTINIGLMKSGTGINTVPAYARFSGEARSYSKKLFDMHLKKIESLATVEGKKLKVNIKFKKDGFCPGYSIKNADKTIQHLVSVFKKMKIKPKLYNFSGISDANILNAKGIKTLVLSDGVVSPHTTQEKISVESLNRMSEVISAIIYTKW